MIALALLMQLQVTGPVEVPGRVVRIIGNDTVAASGARVVLHRVGNSAQGPLDSMMVMPDGAFRFRAVADSGDVLLVSARWHDVEYFAPPITAGATACHQNQTQYEKRSKRNCG